ncbi:hypothetical protein [Paenibacillus herberti]|uniref:Uncharacterized protein n=1 Tax=Paenibacillus herberti TaxID=1619309 RepID=A0A229P512_9BACL|nr:hypothetical protein [Paenibacillus herberti]OXM17141.1 hypothetical protein CGZ75_11130 [Paenibacillus herberti]
MGSIILILLVMLAGTAATIMIGQSKSNKEANTGYSEHSGKKWARLSWIYVVSVVLIAIILLFAI